MGREIYFHSKPLTLLGSTIEKGAIAPSFQAVSLDLEVVTFAASGDKIKLITSFPSLDTPVCDLQVKEFNKRAANFSPDLRLIAISMDLPFAQKRFCDVNSISNLEVVSDYRFSSFGINYGLLIKELRLLARSVLIIDKNNILCYSQVVQELTDALNYQEALQALEDVFKNPAQAGQDRSLRHCAPCEGGSPALSLAKVRELLTKHKGWQLVEDKKIRKTYSFKGFGEAKTFLDLIALRAQEQGHHPGMTISYDKVIVTLTTHASNGLTDNDFIMAGIIDSMGVV
jgi:thioredoxin-dependent peroxiredoxin